MTALPTTPGGMESREGGVAGSGDASVDTILEPERRYTADDLVADAYPILRAIAARAMQMEAIGHTLQPTALAHEAYLRLKKHNAGFSSQAAFLAAAVQAVRRLLIEHARHKKTKRRSHARANIELGQLIAPTGTSGTAIDLFALEDALQKLERMNAQHSHVASFIIFGGCSTAEVARLLQLSPATVSKAWTAARAFLRRELIA